MACLRLCGKTPELNDSFTMSVILDDTIRGHHGPVARAADSRSEDGGFEPWHGRGVVSLGKALYFSLLLPTQE